MKPQPFRVKDAEVVRAFLDARKGFDGNQPRLRFGWSIWGFGTEPLEESAARLQRHGIEWVELPGYLYGPDLGWDPDEVTRILDNHGIKVSGVCGMITPDQEFASALPHARQRAVTYFRRQAEFCAEVGGKYLLFGAGAVGRPDAYDVNETWRAAQTMRLVAGDFERLGVIGAVEPIRPDEVSLVHTFEEALELLDMVDHPGISHLNGDTYHMQAGQGHIGETILAHGDRMVNLHMADSNRRALGDGSMDLDVQIMALYAVGYHSDGKWCTPEPLGAGSNPYVAMNLPPDTEAIEHLVGRSAKVFREREEQVLSATDDELAALYQLSA